MDTAIKWNAVRLDTSSPDAPRISRRELLEHAFDQWSLAEIKAARSFAVFLAAVVANVERAQRIADRFQHWRVPRHIARDVQRIASLPDATVLEILNPRPPA